MSKNLPKIIAVVGPTATGKSDVAVAIATALNGEIISADSRQVYKGLDIGSGKITPGEMQGIPHHLLDVANSQDTFSAEQFKTLAQQAIVDILARNKVPIICGGTGFYIQALVENISFPQTPPNPKLRAELETKSAAELFEMLQHKDPARAETIDPQNPHRLIRALEIAKDLGSVPKLSREPHYDCLYIGLGATDEILKEKISKRLLSRLDQGMIEEAQTLHSNGVTYERMEDLGLEYRYLARFLQQKISKSELIEQLNSEIWQFAKRQRTWFKRNKNVLWFTPQDRENIIEVCKTFIQSQ